MADLDCKPFWGRNKKWTSEDEMDPRKVRYEGGRNKTRSEVMPCDGNFGIEFYLANTLPQFAIAYKVQQWSEAEGYSQFTKALVGDMKIAWEETLEQDFPDESDRTGANWDRANYTFVKKYLNCKRPRDVQLRHHETGYAKPPDQDTAPHFRRFKESLRNTLKLPKGVKPDPTDEKVKEWYFRTYCKKHRYAYLKTGKELENSTMEEITEFMRLQHESDVEDGTIKRMAYEKANRNGRHNRNGGAEKPFRRNASYGRSNDSHSDRGHDDRPLARPTKIMVVAVAWT